MSDTYAVEVQDLHKAFGDVLAVEGVSFSIRRGEIFSLLGPNGAGKSTTISVLSGLLRPDRGTARVMGYSVTDDPGKAKAFIGVVPQEIALYDDLSGRENLTFWGKMYGIRGRPLQERVDEVLDVVGLTDREMHKVGTYSGGMRRRLNIGVALLHKPELIIMDEPTVGIDPQSRRNILDNVKALNREGMTVLYTTHYMEEAQELSDYIAIMDQGKIIATGTHEKLVRIVGELDRLELTIDQDNQTVLDSWQRADGVDSITAEDGVLTLLAADSNSILPRLFEEANRVGTRITSVEIFEPNLETVFLHLTGRALRD